MITSHLLCCRCLAKRWNGERIMILAWMRADLVSLLRLNDRGAPANGGYHGSAGPQAQIVTFSRQNGMPGIQGLGIRLILLDTQEKPMLQWRSLTRRAM